MIGAADASLLEELSALDADELRARLLAGHNVAPHDLAGWSYGGTSLGLPAWVDRLAWKTFVKEFARSGERVHGWNVRIRQDEPRAFRPMLDRRGRPKRFGHFELTTLPPLGALPLPVERGVLLDYGLGVGNGRLDPVRLLRDPLVALRPGDPTLLLGCSLIQAGPARLRTPSYFLLERLRPLDAAP